MLFGQHFDGELPRNLYHVFLTETVRKQFQQKKIGMFMFKNQNDGSTPALSLVISNFHK